MTNEELAKELRILARETDWPRMSSAMTAAAANKLDPPKTRDEQAERLKDVYIQAVGNGLSQAAIWEAVLSEAEAIATATTTAAADKLNHPQLRDVEQFVEEDISGRYIVDMDNLRDAIKRSRGI